MENLYKGHLARFVNGMKNRCKRTGEDTNMDVTKISANAFWKGEIEVKGIVCDGDDSFCVKLYIKGSQVFDYSCSCMRENSYKGMCVHCEEILKEYRKREEKAAQKPVIPTPNVRTMIREYTNREVAQIVRAGEEEKVNLSAHLTLSRYDSKVEFKIGRNRMYLIKDLILFVQSLKNGAYAEYGKQLAFHHNKEVFAPESWGLLVFLESAVLDYQEHFQLFQKGSFSSIPPLRELRLSVSQIDKFIVQFVGKNLEVTDETGRTRQAFVAEENPRLEIDAKPLGTEGICVSVPKSVQVFFGNRHLYVLDGPVLCVCDHECSENLEIFLGQMLHNYGGTGQVDIHKKDIPLFYERVLRKIEPYIILHAPDIDWERYRPEELKASFFFDFDGRSKVSVEPVLSYGDLSFSPMEDETLPRQICRDVPEEFRISQILMRYFKHRDMQGKKLLIQNDDGEVYSLLKEGIPEFMALGEVRCSETFENMKILPPIQPRFGVSLSDGWLDLQMDMDQISGEELAEILNCYQEKKPFYRTKQGEFLELQEDGLQTIARLVKDLGLSEEDIKQKKVKLPAYRAMYLDQVLKETSGVNLYRDKMYRSLIRGMKSMEDSEFEVPESLRFIMREYQKTGYRWLKTLDFYGFGGILADDMGLGKTIQMIALLLKEALEHPKSLSLVICPASLIYNWEHEFKMYAPQIHTAVVLGTAQERAIQIHTAINREENIQVLITSYDLLRKDLSIYQMGDFRYQILDEAQYIKNASTQNAKAVKSIHSKTRFAMTGTPVENRLSELWSIMDYVMPGFLFSYSKFRRELETPIIKEKDAEKLERLRRLIGPFLLRRVKHDVLKELPEKLETVVYSGLQGEQKTLYLANASVLRQQLKESNGKDQMMVLAGLTRLRQICCDPSLCYEEYSGNSAKMDTCMGLIENGIAADHRILVFSQFTSMLEHIGKELKEREIPYYLLTGSTSKEERQRLSMEFGKTEIRVFLISLKAGGTGLNLTAADMVIHYDPWWNEAAQEQATDRAHRIGQKKQVSVFKLIMQNSIEEGILKLQSHKRTLSEKVITQGMIRLESLSREDMIELLGE